MIVAPTKVVNVFLLNKILLTFHRGILVCYNTCTSYFKPLPIQKVCIVEINDVYVSNKAYIECNGYEILICHWDISTKRSALQILFFDEIMSSTRKIHILRSLWNLEHVWKVCYSLKIKNRYKFSTYS